MEERESPPPVIEEHAQRDASTLCVRKMAGRHFSLRLGSRQPFLSFVFCLLYLVLLFSFLYTSHSAFATSYLSRISDLISTSAPGAAANHTLRFTIAQAIPPNGAIEVLFNRGGFTIPGALNFTDVDLGFSAVSGGPYTERPLSSVQTGGTDRVVVTSGSAGKIRFDLNTSVGIAAGSELRIKIGTNATFGTVGDQRILLPTATTSHPVTVYTYDAADAELDYGETRIAVVEQVTAGPVDTDDVTPPVVLAAYPSGLLQVGTRAVQMWVVTDELTACRWATSSMAYASMPYSFTSTSTFGLAYWNFATYGGLEDDTEYNAYIRCVDFRSNEIDPDYILSFTVGITPGSASSTATTTGTGTGTGTGTSTGTSTGTGTGTGTGGGPSGSGSGNGPNGGDGAGSGGGGSGQSGSGDKLPQADVQVSGWAYPGSTVTLLRDGAIVATQAAGGGGEFLHLTEGIDRGIYSFAVYATDSKGTRSATYATTLGLRSNTLNKLANIMLPPTVSVVAASVDPGKPVEVSGYSAPSAKVTAWLRPRLAVVSAADVVASTTALANGIYTLSIPTTGLTQGTYELVAQAAHANGTVQSDKSARLAVGLGVQVTQNTGCKDGDLNCDGSVNLIDFSILLFNWNTASTVADINKDGTVSLPDFSILLFNWTG